MNLADENRLKFMSMVETWQSPPRQRTIINGGELVRLFFPWVTLAYRSGIVFCYFHNEPWKDISETSVLRMPPCHFFHVGCYGDVCLDGGLTNRLTLKTITPPEAFWMSDGFRDIPSVLLSENLGRKWGRVNWEGMNYFLEEQWWINNDG